MDFPVAGGSVFELPVFFAGITKGKVMSKNRFELQQANLQQASSMMADARRKVSMALAELAVSAEWLENYKYTGSCAEEAEMDKIAEVAVSIETSRRCVKDAAILMERYSMILDRAINDHKLEVMRVAGVVEAIDAAMRMIR